MKIRPLIIASILILFTSGCSRPGTSVQAEPDAAGAEKVIPDFNISRDQLALLAADLKDQETARAIVARPAEFLILMRKVLDESDELFLIADKRRSLMADYIPADLLPLTDFPLLLNRTDLSLRAPVIPDLLAMDQAARNEGLRLVYSSSYRSYEYQDGLFARNVAQLGEEEAARVSARPGTSQHQLGTTIDFGSITDAFAATAEGRWLKDNAWHYGFSLSYPEGYEALTGYVWESWHYRYIGRPAADMERMFFGSIQHRLLYFLDAHSAWFEERRLPW